MLPKRYLRTMQFLPGSRAAVLSGGGALGAFNVGQMYELNDPYDLTAGISTGALQAPLVALGLYDRLAEAYQNVTLNSIFSRSPFTQTGKIRWAYSSYRVLSLKHSVGEMYNLRQLIKKFYTPADHRAIRDQNKVVIVGAVNMTREPHRMELFCPLVHDYDTFCAAMYASSCFYPVGEMAPIRQPDNSEHYYADGGFLESIIIREASRANINSIDVFVLKHQIAERLRPRPSNVFRGSKRLLTAMRYDMVYENLENAIEDAEEDESLAMRVFRLPKKLTNNAMYFNREQMRGWFELGRQQAHDYTLH